MIDLSCTYASLSCCFTSATPLAIPKSVRGDLRCCSRTRGIALPFAEIEAGTYLVVYISVRRDTAMPVTMGMTKPSRPMRRNSLFLTTTESAKGHHVGVLISLCSIGSPRRTTLAADPSGNLDESCLGLGALTMSWVRALCKGLSGCVCPTSARRPRKG